MEKNESDKAIADLNWAIQLNPAEVSTFFQARAYAWTAKEDFERATNDLEEALRLEPNDLSTHVNLAWIRATGPVENHRNGPQAIELATKACGLTDWKAPDCLLVLAAALAETGDFDQAVERQIQAIDLLDETSPDRSKYQRGLELYQSGRPYRSVPFRTGDNAEPDDTEDGFSDDLPKVFCS